MLQCGDRTNQTRESLCARTLAQAIRARNIKLFVQPIVDLVSGDIVGVELLARGSGAIASIETNRLFSTASQHNLLASLERIVRDEAFKLAGGLPDHVLIFVNNSPETCAVDGFAADVHCQMQALCDVDPHRIVMEITECMGDYDLNAIGREAVLLRELGFQVAIDDVGAGINGLQQITSVRPNWIKLDRALVQDIDQDHMRQNLIRSLVQFVRRSDLGLIAEGVERSEEIEQLIRLGVTHAQGYFLARPAAALPQINPDAQRVIKQLRGEQASALLDDNAPMRVRSLARPVVTCEGDVTLTAAIEQCHAVEIETIVVMRRGKVCGLIDRATLEEIAAESRPDRQLGTLTFKPVLAVDAELTHFDVLESLGAGGDRTVLPNILVRDGDSLLGWVSMSRLFAAAGRVGREQSAGHLGMACVPSRVDADQWLAKHIEKNDPVDVVFVDLRGFEAYNLRHGYANGDRMLQCIAELLQQHVVHTPDGVRFWAHLGADQFLLAFDGLPHRRLQAVAHKFEALLSDYFTPMEMASQAFHAPDARGVVKPQPLTSLRLLHLPHALQRVDTPSELYALILRIRSMAKQDELASVCPGAAEMVQCAAA